MFHPTATEPIDFVHMKYDGEDCLWVQHEGGQNPPGSLTMNKAEFNENKYRAKCSLEPYVGYNWKHDLPKKADKFLKGMEPGEQKLLAKKNTAYWGLNADRYGNQANAWYMIMEGPNTGLYQNPRRFQQIRDENYNETPTSAATKANNEFFSWKASWFHSLEDAKTFIQYCRDEEGLHFAWPWKCFPIHWSRTYSDDEANEGCPVKPGEGASKSMKATAGLD